MWNYGILSAKFLVSSLKVIGTAGFLSFFEFFTLTIIEISPVFILGKSAVFNQCLIAMS